MIEQGKWFLADAERGCFVSVLPRRAASVTTFSYAGPTEITLPMLTFLRIYLYWSVLWGFLTYPAASLRDLIPIILVGVDLLLMAVTISYAIIQLPQLPNKEARNLVRTIGAFLIALSFYGVALAAINDGSIVRAVNYMGALSRFLLLLTAFFVYSELHNAPITARYYRIVRVDLFVLLIVQTSVATIQLFYPDAGSFFVVSLNEYQSSKWAFAEGNITGTFPNSIDLAYFYLAAYVSLTINIWAQKKLPSIALTIVILFYVYATGSVAALVCTVIYIVYLLWHSNILNLHLFAHIFAAFSAIALAIYNMEIVSGSLIARYEDMMHSRLGLLFVTLPQMAVSAPIDFIIGSGADFGVVFDKVRSLPDIPLAFTYYKAGVVINDVFWAALVLALGIPMSLAYLLYCCKVFFYYVTHGAAERQLLIFVMVIFSIVLFSGFFNQILMVRSFIATLCWGLLPMAFISRARRTRDGYRGSLQVNEGR